MVGEKAELERSLEGHGMAEDAVERVALGVQGPFRGALFTAWTNFERFGVLVPPGDEFIFSEDFAGEVTNERDDPVEFVHVGKFMETETAGESREFEIEGIGHQRTHHDPAGVNPSNIVRRKTEAIVGIEGEIEVSDVERVERRYPFSEPAATVADLHIKGPESGQRGEDE